MKKDTALKQAKEGKFKFVENIRPGINIVKYQTSTGKWKEKTINIECPTTYKRP